MAVFSKAKKTQAFLKMGVMGFTGSGKTYTASQIAVGLHRHCKEHQGKSLKVFFLDTETGSDFTMPMFDQAGIDVLQAKTRAFKDLGPAVDEASKAKGILLIDSISHFWTELQDSYMVRKGRTRLMFQDWAWLKSEWRKFTDKYVNSPCHIIMCGRAGYEYDFFEDEAGKKELEKTGVRMKAETETGYEPSILVMMERKQELIDEIPRTIRRGHVLKDRAFGEFNLDGKVFENPTFEDFLPHVKFLNIGGKHLGTKAGDSQDMVPDDDPSWAIEKKQREVLLDEVKELLVKYHPSTAMAEKAKKADLMEEYFGTRSWKKIETFKVDKIRPCYKKLRDHLEPGWDEVPQDLTSEPDTAPVTTAESKDIPF